MIQVNKVPHPTNVLAAGRYILAEWFEDDCEHLVLDKAGIEARAPRSTLGTQHPPWAALIGINKYEVGC